MPKLVRWIYLIFFISLSQLIGSQPYCTKVLVSEKVEVSLYTPAMFRIRISELPGEKFPEKYEIPFVIGHVQPWDEVSFENWREGDFEYIKTSEILLEVNDRTDDWKVYTPDGYKPICPSHGPVVGMFRDGYTVFDNASAFGEYNANSRFSHWFYNKETGRYIDTFLEEDLISDRYFIYGPAYEKLFSQMNLLIGPEPLLPKKAYGFFQTQHLGCQGDQQQLLDVAHQLRDRDIPCDGLIIDFEWGDGCDGSEEVKWGSRLDWNENYTQPLSPKAMLDALKQMHFQVMLIHHSAPDFPSRKWHGWTESLFDSETWWTKLKEKIDMGVDGTWQDTRRNDITDAYIWQGLQDYFGENRRVLFMGCRKMQAVNPWDNYFTALPMNQLIGSRRYPFDWTGDCSYSWMELAWQIKAITDTHGAMKGISYTSSDAVGADWRIQARWNQFTDFTAVSRSHNPKPWSGNIDVRDFVKQIQITGRDTLAQSKIGAQNDQKQKETAEESIRKNRKLRYRLLPYIYSAAYHTYQTGMPVCRPMLLAFPDDYRCAADQWPYQYMFGDWLLIAPVYGDFQTMEIYLPEDHDWVDFWSDVIYQGGGILRYDVSDITKLPVFIKAGAIVPMAQERNWIDPAVPDRLTFQIYPVQRSTATLYEDDGVSTKYQNGFFSEQAIRCEKSDENIQIVLGHMKGHYEGKPKKRSYRIHIHHIFEKPHSVQIDNRPIPYQSHDSSVKNKKYKYDSSKALLIIKTNNLDTAKDHDIIIRR